MISKHLIVLFYDSIVLSVFVIDYYGNSFINLIIWIESILTERIIFSNTHFHIQRYT